MRRTTALLLALAAGFAPAAFAVPGQAPSPSADVVTFGVQPATATRPDSRAAFTYNVTPGARLDDHVAVLNYSVRPLTLTVYATDALNTDAGGFGLLEGGKRPVGAGAWVALGTPGGRGSVTVPPRSRSILPVRIVVPAQASPGDHVGGIVASLATTGKDKDGANVRLDQRIAARVYVRVAGPVRPALAVERLHVSYRRNWNPIGTGSTRVTYRIRNVGNVKLGGRPQVRVDGLFGTTSRARNLPVVPMLLPGNAVDVAVTVGGVFPQFRGTARVTVTPLVPQGDVDPGLRDASASRGFWAVPWVLLGILLVIGAAGWWWRHHRRRRAAETGRGRHRAGALVGASTALLCLSLPAHADGVPYTDAQAGGVIGFCDKNGRPVTGGRLDDTPFAAKVVSSMRAPAPYDGEGRGTWLLAYQPRPNVPPGQWSGEQLTASSSYTDAAHPMAEVTYGDVTLRQVVGDFPPQWDGLLQLRMYFKVTGEPVYNARYPATDIRVTGDTWRVVRGGSVPCNTGTATSAARALAPDSVASPVPGTPSQRPPSGGPSVPAAAPGVPTSPAASTAAAAPGRDGRGSTTSPALLTVAGVLAAAAAGFALWRRRPVQSSPPRKV